METKGDSSSTREGEHLYTRVLIQRVYEGWGITLWKKESRAEL